MMRFYLTIIFISFCCFITVNCHAQQAGNQSNNSKNSDSAQVATVSLGFYNWYLNCLKHDSTYNIIQPLYHWEDTIPVLETQKYIDKLEEMGLVSGTFINFEKERFRICQDSLNHIDYEEVIKDGVSVGSYYKECYFIDSYYWLDSQEYPDSCEIRTVQIANNTASCQLAFFWNSELSGGKQYDSNFYCNMNLIKSGKKWLIDWIDIKRN